MSQLPNRSIEGIITIDGVNFRWWLHREPRWSSTHGWKGVAIGVALAKSSCRELIIEFPFEAKSRRSTPNRQRPKISEKEIETQVRNAMSAGWEPESRGKAFVFDA